MDYVHWQVCFSLCVRFGMLTPNLALAVVGFVLCTIPKLHLYVLLFSTAFVGSTAFVLGVDCYTTAGLKEVWLNFLR